MNSCTVSSDLFINARKGQRDTVPGDEEKYFVLRCFLYSKIKSQLNLHIKIENHIKFLKVLVFFS